MNQTVWSNEKIKKIIENADDEQLVTLIKETSETNIDIFDNDSDTLEENEPLINNNPEVGRYALLSGYTVINQADKVKNLLTLPQWTNLFNILINKIKDQSLIETLNTFLN